MDKQTDIISKISKYKGAIFDLDGTLMDLGVDWKNLKQELTKYCYSKKNIKIEFTPLDQKLFELKKLFGEQFYSELLDIISDFEMKEENYKFNQELLDYINLSTHQKIAIYSMNTKKCINNIVKKHFERRPDIIISKYNCIEPKPTDEDIRFILDQWKFKSKEVIFIGNSRNDFLSGQKAGVVTFIIS